MRPFLSSVVGAFIAVPGYVEKAAGTLFPFHFAAWHVANASISAIVNESDDAARNLMMDHWRAAMLSQLSNVELIGAIMSAAVVGAFTWDSLSSLSTIAYALVQMMWYCSLVLGIGAVAVGLQQSVFLIRIGCLPTANQLCRDMLSRDPGNDRRRVPRWHQVLIWQTAVALLEFSVYTWLAGFVVFIWATTRSGQADASTSDRVVAAFPLLAFLAVVILYTLSMLRLWYIAGKHESHIRS
ncbi:hypothetical protein PG989_000838 [Apiospora arundinis]